MSYFFAVGAVSNLHGSVSIALDTIEAMALATVLGSGITSSTSLSLPSTQIGRESLRVSRIGSVGFKERSLTRGGRFISDSCFLKWCPSPDEEGQRLTKGSTDGGGGRVATRVDAP